ncbi:MAG: class I SAM-dependent methyltransferase [Candidatus Contendobacter sp.]|nr:class I SAM-dependent methyltransferase [Candidatus Contendobacter sp.]
MQYSDLDHVYQAYMQDFITNSYPEKWGFNYQIDDHDEMFKAVVQGYDYARDAYLAYMQSGWRMLSVVRQLADFAFGGLSNVRSFLEFACGYGRFTRHLVMECPVAHIIVSDIYREAVDWQNRQFGVCGIYSTSLPDEFPLVTSFDMIFVGSLFSHLPEKLFEQWLKKLFSMLNPGGVIVLSVHDCHLIPGTPPKADRKDQVFLYEKHSESGTLSGEIYGTTYVSEKYVSELIRKVCPKSGGIYRRFMKGLYENQDIYIIPCDTNHDWSRFELVIAPIGGKWFCESKENEIVGSAWALNLNPRGHFDFADIYINDTHIKTMPTVVEASGVIERYFPGLQTHPIRCDFRLPKFEIPINSVLKCRFSATPDCYFDVYMNYFGMK